MRARWISHSACSEKIGNACWYLFYGERKIYSSGYGTGETRSITAIGFTGSYRGGKALFDEANKRPVPIPVYAEMGSTNPVFIFPDALKERKEKIAQDLAAAVTLGVGQFCTNPGLVFIPKSDDGSKFKDALATNIKGINAGVMLTSGIQGSFQKGIEKLSAAKGVEVLAQGPSEGSGSRGTAHLLHALLNRF